jgi:hypothetical protein
MYWLRVLAIAAVAAAAVGTCPIIDKGSCITGGEAYKFLTNITSASGCCAACQQDSKCLAWMLKNSSQNCALKSINGPTKKSPQCLFSGHIAPTGPTPKPAPSPSQPTPRPAPTVFAFDSDFKGGAVLQHGVEVTVWGTHATGDTVTVKLDGGKAIRATVNGGNWSATLPPQKTGFNRTLVATDGVHTDTATVSFGHVILCSGQSK